MNRHSAMPSHFVPAPVSAAERPREPRGRPARSRHARGAQFEPNASGRDLAAFEELYPLVADTAVTDVLVLGDRGVWTDAGAGLRPAPGMRMREERVRELATRLIALGGRHVDETTPFADVGLADGIRVHVLLAPVSVGGTSIAIRLPARRRFTLDDLEASGMFERGGRATVDAIVHERRNVLITGATGSGKTTLLRAMLAAVPGRERIITVEDVAELSVDHPHVVALEARQPNTEGAGGIGLDRLVREALRMRPDRIVVGECRGAEVRELMAALNTGHAGGAGTMHANGLDDVPARLEALGALAGLAPVALARQAVSAFDTVLHVTARGGRRRLETVGRLGSGPDDRLTVTSTPVRQIARAA
jgi:pilus assembly protein CpaF